MSKTLSQSIDGSRITARADTFAHFVGMFLDPTKGMWHSGYFSSYGNLRTMAVAFWKPL